MTFLDDMKLGGLKNMLGGRMRFHKGLDKLEYWTKSNKINFNSDTSGSATFCMRPDHRLGYPQPSRMIACLISPRQVGFKKPHPSLDQ